ncbi:hypothetical protein [Leucobacter tenebrionis]|uniref:hypothetical protein n=1 Tax=Leucobacter tenebrionis TaxID=2873270 RepID=UPI001CA64BE1|nr:hypothetical protein [Leucobacter tenebrionis]QZY52918.1 hypothetical protein KVY00_05650 [Leucobacter tenebrionis]
MITHDMVGTDEDLAREVLLVARGIAPCISSFADGSEEQKDAIAILRRVYKDITARGLRFVKSQRIGSAAVDYGAITSAFDGDPTRALRALCSSTNGQGLSLGSFPKERPVSRIWPERY